MKPHYPIGEKKTTAKRNVHLMALLVYGEYVVAKRFVVNENPVNIPGKKICMSFNKTRFHVKYT